MYFNLTTETETKDIRNSRGDVVATLTLLTFCVWHRDKLIRVSCGEPIITYAEPEQG